MTTREGSVDARRRVDARQTATRLLALRRTLVLCILSGATIFSATSALAAEGKRPVIVSMSAGVGGEVTVGAKINPEGLETIYEIELECGPGEPLPCDSIPSERRKGHLAAGYEAREISLTLTGLQPGTYWFGVRASNSAGETSLSSNILNIPPVPPGACPNGCSTNEPYKGEPGHWTPSAQEAADRATANAEAERRHAKEHEEQEQQAKEAAIRAAEAAALKLREEEEAATASRVAPVCVVPSLEGDSLSTARRALVKAHCQLGKISRPRHHASTLRVTRQNPQHGKRLPNGAAVSVILGSAGGRSGSGVKQQGVR